jgi:hypothetical protein
MSRVSPPPTDLEATDIDNKRTSGSMIHISKFTFPSITGQNIDNVFYSVST